MNLAGVRWLSFDCYGTLIDWESGILGAVRPVLARHGASPRDEEILERYASLEAELERGEYLRYRQMLSRAMRGLGEAFAVALSETECEALPASLGDWPPFPDTADAMRSLKRRFRLAVLSNVDDDLFAATAPRLGVALDLLVTAQQCRSYKPSHNNFRRLIERTGAGPGELVHVAQSLYHDIVPARELGLPSIWIHRRSGRSGSGATPPVTAVPDLEFPDMASLAAHALRA
jgi:2-haloacid dehalogenase